MVTKVGEEDVAALLFSEKAEKWIPGAYVKVGMFGADDSDLLYHDDVHGSLLEQAEKTLDLVYFKCLKAKIWYENGEQRVEKFPFPREGLRELIYNALVHKDYGSAGGFGGQAPVGVVVLVWNVAVLAGYGFLKDFVTFVRTCRFIVRRRGCTPRS